MDISKEYIKMCEKAVEIQREWCPGDGDYVVYKGNDEEIENRVHIFPLAESWTDWTVKDFTFIYRQDQLQEMVKNKGLVDLLNDFSDFWLNPDKAYTQYVDDFISMEQLWLAFVMKEKYQKVWDGEEWK